MYTSAFRRLAKVTQVVSADEVHVFHNRLTHSLQVAQVARRIAEHVLRSSPSGFALDPDVCEAAALAHDLGHPPFGHLAEETLDAFATKEGLVDGFEGNAQSFRIITKLAGHDISCSGLDLTRATLDAVLKYPWMRGDNPYKTKKWGAYTTEKQDLEWARAMHQPMDHRQGLEAAIMDWADDVTYSVHDLEDFYKAGLIPLELLGTSSRERERFLADLIIRKGESLPKEWTETYLMKVFEVLAGGWSSLSRFEGTLLQRQTLKAISSTVIGNYVTGLKVEVGVDGHATLVIPRRSKVEVYMLKELTWHYVILNSALASQQHGQRKVIEDLATTYYSAACEGNDSALLIFPPLYRDELRAHRTKGKTKKAILRTVLDLISGMTERQAIEMHHRLNGISLGSALIHSLS